jgi:uncharacterized repeat protein (TIGR03803 family)
MSARAQSPSSPRVLYYFQDCSLPDTPLIFDGRGNLYGGTSLGGPNNQGCIFELSPSQGGWQLTILHSFSGPDGAGPGGALIFDKSGNLYGTTVTGGAYEAGTVFELSPSGDGAWSETVLHDFGGQGDGTAPESNLVFDSAGNLYGTTIGGGTQSRPGGTVFKLSPGQNAWTETVLYSFPGLINGPDADGPEGGVVMDREGRLYGTAGWGGAYGSGAVYVLAPSPKGYREEVIYSFNGSDGTQPNSGLTIGPGNRFYGTTAFGGTAVSCPFCGVVFSLGIQPDGTWAEDTLHEMLGTDGWMPVGPVVFDQRGNLYAAAEEGGINRGGSVFMLTPTVNGPWDETVLHLFDFQFPDGKDGQQPYAGVSYRAGRIVGTTTSGGIYNKGIVFEGASPSDFSVSDLDDTTE